MKKLDETVGSLGGARPVPGRSEEVSTCVSDISKVQTTAIEASVQREADKVRRWRDKRGEREGREERGEERKGEVRGQKSTSPSGRVGWMAMLV